VIKDIGAISFGRWHSAQFLKSMGATSLLKVTCFLTGELALVSEKVKKQAASKTTAVTEMDNLHFIIKNLLENYGKAAAHGHPRISVVIY
jgi:hypothetical protein